MPEKSPEKDSKPPKRVVLGPDGKPCRACNESTSFMSWGKSASKSVAGGTLATAASSYASRPRPECPPDLASLGNATWTFLHTTASYYPPRPSPAHQKQMLNLLHSLPTLYPCPHCAEHLGEMMKATPPDKVVNTREGVMKWLCERHNEVNELLGKDKFDCSPRNLDERWKDGPKDGSCD
jgi:mitochondrial FAD-linked sulfhydryl oxidase